MNRPGAAGVAMSGSSAAKKLTNAFRSLPVCPSSDTINCYFAPELRNERSVF